MLWAFFAVLLFFHTSEFFLQRYYNPDDVSARSLLITREYILAVACAISEYFIEWTLVPSFKAALWPLQLLGAFLVVSGEVLRKAAISTAGPSFTHDIKTSRRDCHVLVTKGVYRLMRHPSYAGWFTWSVGTQLLLANPICSAAFAVVAWRFFCIRIPYEEYLLCQFFGTEYSQYASTTPSGLPFIS